MSSKQCGSARTSELDAFVAEACGSRVTSRRVVQRLWSGYGSINKLGLENGQSVIVKHVAPGRHTCDSEEDPVGSRSHLRKLTSYEVEQTFYERYAARLLAPKSSSSQTRVARVARLLASRRGLSRDDDDPEVQRYLLLEDLDASGYAGRRDSLRSLDAARPLVAWLARFHRAFLEADDDVALCADADQNAGKTAAVRPSSSDDDTTRDGLWREGCYWHLDTRKDELAEMPPGDPLKVHARALDRLLKRARHVTLVHGDAKIANFCFSPDGTDVAAVDFQYVGRGVGVRDLAYLLGSCFDEARMTRFNDALLDAYFAELDAGDAVETEWRALWPVCFADFERFLAGWRPQGHWKRNGYTQTMVRRALAMVAEQQR